MKPISKSLRNALTPLLAAACLAPSIAAAGVTIYYEGRAVDAAAVKTVIQTVRDEARRHGWRVLDASHAEITLERVVGYDMKTYRGPVEGVSVFPALNCEPLHFQFDTDGFMQDQVKTQFASPAIHIAITELLRKIAPHLTRFEVDDEGEYWDTGDARKLQDQIDTINARLAAMKRARRDLKGPVTMPDGRIVDLMGRD